MVPGAWYRPEHSDRAGQHRESRPHKARSSLACLARSRAGSFSLALSPLSLPSFASPPSRATPLSALPIPPLSTCTLLFASRFLSALPLLASSFCACYWCPRRREFGVLGCRGEGGCEAGIAPWRASWRFLGSVLGDSMLGFIGGG